ncbi:hypothetical protein DVH24_039164 [Malus domestica]|uniref:Uncharacterized protein n=1 Tax=Malus domestica TaxID=3750 RepID=A0A498K9C2_MALDO|nr:hypothetical protein DVH24_039164 [Malus domestica]
MKNIADEAFWELTGFGFHWNSKVKRVRARAIPGWVTPWEVLMVKLVGIGFWDDGLQSARGGIDHRFADSLKN